jgi:hypothetical protein
MMCFLHRECCSQKPEESDARLCKLKVHSRFHQRKKAQVVHATWHKNMPDVRQLVRYDHK